MASSHLYILQQRCCAVPQQLFNELIALRQVLNLNNASGTAYVAMQAGTTSGWRWDVLIAGNTDTIAHNINLQYNAGGVLAHLGTVNVPAGAGQGAVAAVDLLAALPLGLRSGIIVQAGDQLAVRVEETIVAPFIVEILAVGGSF